MENYKEPSSNTEKLEESSTEAVAAVAAPAPKIEKRKIAEPVAVDIEAVRDSLPKPSGPAVVGNGAVDTVKLSSIVYKNLYAKKSLSVHHLQRRLNELNYSEAYGDRDGWFGDNTKSALARFQADNRVGADGLPDLKTLKKLFAGDPNVEVAE
jgi:peptidoglycan hydrolase-like protein with peptidoglycan-binding domain